MEIQENSVDLRHIENNIWTPVRTKPRREKKVAEYSKANNIDFYLPLKKNIHRYSRRTVQFYVPMFPGYVFCSLNEDKYQRLLRSNSIVYRINIDKAQEEDLIRELKAVQALEKMSEEQEVVVKPELASGTKVQINDGPMKGMEGIVSRRKGKTLVTVNIEILGQSVTAETDVGDLEIIDN